MNVRHIPFQQNLQMFPLAFVIMRGVSSSIEDLLPLVPDTIATLDQIAQRPIVAGDLYEIQGARREPGR